MKVEQTLMAENQVYGILPHIIIQVFFLKSIIYISFKNSWLIFFFLNA